MRKTMTVCLLSGVAAVCAILYYASCRRNDAMDESAGEGDFVLAEKRASASTRRIRPAAGGGISSCFASLRRRAEDVLEGVSAPGLAAKKNLLMDEMLMRESIPPGYGREMCALSEDRDQDELTRNFAVQHIERSLCERQIRGEAGDASGDQPLLDELWRAASERSTSVGGVALLALARLSREMPRVSGMRIAGMAESCLNDEKVSRQTRLAAVQVCGMVSGESAIPLLRHIASDDAEPLIFRRAAAHSLGLVLAGRGGRVAQ